MVQEGTDLGDVTDADGKFEIGPNISSIRNALSQRSKVSALRVDAQGRFFRGNEKAYHKVYLSKPGTTALEASSARTLSKKSAASDATLLISHAGHFGSIEAVDGASSAPLALAMELISEFQKSNRIEPSVANLNVLEFTDSTLLTEESGSKENPTCKGGKVAYLPDTTEMQYKIVGKTLYLWDPEDTDSSGNYATVMTSSTGNKLSTWNWNGMTMSPALPVDSAMQGKSDSIMEMVHDMIKVSGVTSFSSTKVHNDVVYAFCYGSLMAMAFSQPPMTATAKSCSEAELKNGDETAIWSFTDDGNKAITKFTYKDTTCLFESTSSAEPAYSCEGIADGEAPEDTSGTVSGPDQQSLSECPAYMDFILGGFDIPGLPPLGKQQAKALPNPMSLERKARAHLPKFLR